MVVAAAGARRADDRRWSRGAARGFRSVRLEGIGTPAPVAPTERLVVGGAYRFVRNPMYLAVAALIIGQAFLPGQATLFLYAAAFGVAVAAFVHGYEEPVLARRFGAQYEGYRREVPAWWPRLTPWEPGSRNGRTLGAGRGRGRDEITSDWRALTLALACGSRRDASGGRLLPLVRGESLIRVGHDARFLRERRPLRWSSFRR